MREAIYKGATRPAMKWGVPLTALVTIFMPSVVLAVWGAVLLTPWVFPLVVLVLAPLYGWMRYVTAKDDQRLIQMIKRVMLARLNPNRRLWKARSYSPHRMRKAQDVRF